MQREKTSLVILHDDIDIFSTKRQHISYSYHKHTIEGRVFQSKDGLHDRLKGICNRQFDLVNEFNSKLETSNLRKTRFFIERDGARLGSLKSYETVRQDSKSVHKALGEVQLENLYFPD